MALFSRPWRFLDIWHFTYWKKCTAFAKFKDCHSKSVPKTRSCLPNDPCHDPPRVPCPTSKQVPPRRCLKPPICHPNADFRKLIFWRMLSLFVGLPLVAIMSVVTYIRQKEKAKQPREPFLNLPYMCRRTKPFPWGDGNHTLFHNPIKNPIPPHGYEVEDPNKPADKEIDN